MDPLMPPPVRRIAVDREPTVAPPRPAANGATPGPASATTRSRSTRLAPGLVREWKVCGWPMARTGWSGT